VGYFWLTHGLAFTPLHGSALYIDVRLVPHCSHTCTVHSMQPHSMARLEGRYGESGGAAATQRALRKRGLLVASTAGT
jgi:hypothetical protein